MRKILPVFLIVLFFFVPYSNVWAAPVSINDVISSSRARGSPLGDCIGPDGKHFQTTKAVCDTFNKAWDKQTVIFAVGAPSPISDTTTISEVIAKSQASAAPLIDCTGPDKKVFKTAKEVCDRFNSDWNKGPSASSAAPAIAPAANLSEVIKTSLTSRSPLGDCIGPDKKHFDATREVCEAFNNKWGKTSTSFNPGVTTGIGLSAITRSSGGGSSSGAASGGGGSTSGGGAGFSGGGKSSSGGSSVGSPTSGKSTGSPTKSKGKSEKKGEKKSDNKEKKDSGKD